VEVEPFFNFKVPNRFNIPSDPIYGQGKPVDLSPGTILIADPFLNDPNFERSVLLLLHADAKEGHMGLVLNKETGEGILPHHDAVVDFLATRARDDVKVAKQGAAKGLPLWRSGGPVDTKEWFILKLCSDPHDHVFSEINFMQLGEGDEEGVEDLLRYNAIAETKDQDLLLFFAGYAGWTAGQLEMEIENKSWIQYSGGFDWINHIHQADLWTVLLKSMGGEHAMLATFPRHPILN
jgi:putative transcriptional regulator